MGEVIELLRCKPWTSMYKRLATQSDWQHARSVSADWPKLQRPSPEGQLRRI